MIPTIILNPEQQIDSKRRLEELSEYGIEVGKIIELWKHPNWYTDRSGMLDPGKDTENSRHYIKYQDQFGVFHLALLAEKHFVTITEITTTPYHENDVQVTIYAEADGMFFQREGYTHNGEWNQSDSKEEGWKAVFCKATQAYNSHILILDKEGKRPKPAGPIMVCEHHDYAHEDPRGCPICKGNPYPYKDTDKPKLNPKMVSILNEGIYTLPQA